MNTTTAVIERITATPDGRIAAAVVIIAALYFAYRVTVLISNGADRVVASVFFLFKRLANEVFGHDVSLHARINGAMFVTLSLSSILCLVLAGAQSLRSAIIGDVPPGILIASFCLSTIAALIAGVFCVVFCQRHEAGKK